MRKNTQPIEITAERFVDWQTLMGLNDAETARALGISRKSVQKYKLEGATRNIALACSAYALGLPPWGSADPARLGQAVGKNTK